MGGARVYLEIGNTQFFLLANNSLERTQPVRNLKYDVAVLRRSDRDREVVDAGTSKHHNVIMSP